MKPTILFLGTPGFALPILEKLHETCEIKAVITQPDKPVGRKQVLSPPPIKALAEKLGLPILQPNKASEIPNLISELISEPVDFLVTAAYGEYLPEAVLKLPGKDALNIHPSLLPKYRGATPMQSAILNSDTVTGVSIIRMVAEMDAGPVFIQEELSIDSDMRYPELEKECSLIGAKLIDHVISHYDDITPQDQNSSQASKCHKISKADGQINWAKESPEQIYNKLRAFTPWPGVFTYWNEQKLAITDLHPLPGKNSDISDGGVYREDIGVFIQCKGGSIELTTVQLAGKKPAPISDFLNGHQDFIGSQLQ